jgi:hypothetical protein
MSQPDAEPRVTVTPPDDPKRPRRPAAGYLSWMCYAATALSLLAFLTLYAFVVVVFEATATGLQAFSWGLSGNHCPGCIGGLSNDRETAGPDFGRICGV